MTAYPRPLQNFLILRRAARRRRLVTQPQESRTYLNSPRPWSIQPTPSTELWRGGCVSTSWDMHPLQDRTNASVDRL
ncbi:MAG: hypothetical protein WC943_05215 [Elusimicrobiota bacterium]